jgi:hypothetical protein
MIINPNEDSRPRDPEQFKPIRSGKGELMGFNIVGKRWLQIRDIFAEHGPTDRLLLALEIGHGIKIHDVTFAPGHWYRLTPGEGWNEIDPIIHGRQTGDQYVGTPEKAAELNALRREALKDNLQENPILFFVVSEEQKMMMAKHAITSPTWLQILGTSEVIDTNEERAVQRFRQLKGDPRA